MPTPTFYNITLINNDNWIPVSIKLKRVNGAAINGYIESAEQSRTAEQNKISKLTVKLR